MNSFIAKAIEFATSVHKTQKRKGKDVPYITHPLAVSKLLSSVTDDENIITAGILHDTIEDCTPYGSMTKETLAREFNADVARMVNDVTEQDKTLPWAIRKAAALAHIPHMQHDALLVKTADVLQNLSDLIADIRTDGIEVFKKFNASKEDTIARYKKLEETFSRVWPENPLLSDLRHVMKEFLWLV